MEGVGGGSWPAVGARSVWREGADHCHRVADPAPPRSTEPADLHRGGRDRRRLGQAGQCTDRAAVMASHVMAR